MQPMQLIDKYYDRHPQAKAVLLAHSRLVARQAVSVAQRIQDREPVDTEFVEQAALLHDIGMLFTDAPRLGCVGDQPYINHGIIGAELLRSEGFPRHALVCERHIGVGLSVEDVKAQGLLLPLRDMSPQTAEEQIVAYADLFFSKTQQGMRTPEMVRISLAHYGQHKVAIFDTWHARFEL